MTTNWRIKPPAALEYAVEQAARRESRSTSNMLLRLISEALQTRTAAAAAKVAQRMGDEQ
jgi:hypothetical protein